MEVHGSCHSLGYDKQFITFDLWRRPVLLAEDSSKISIEGARRKLNLREAIPGKVLREELNGRRDRMFFADPGEPESRPRQAAREIGQSVEQEAVVGNKVREQVECILDAHQVLENVVAENYVECPGGESPQLPGRVEHGQAKCLSCELGATPGDFKAHGLVAALPQLMSSITPRATVVEDATDRAEGAEHLDFGREVEGRAGEATPHPVLQLHRTGKFDLREFFCELVLIICAGVFLGILGPAKNKLAGFALQDL